MGHSYFRLLLRSGTEIRIIAVKWDKYNKITQTNHIQNVTTMLLNIKRYPKDGGA